MNRNLLDLSGKINCFLKEIFETMADVANSAGIPFFVVGASARDIVAQFSKLRLSEFTLKNILAGQFS